MSEARQFQTAKPTKIPTILEQGGPTSLELFAPPSRSECEALVQALDNTLQSAESWTEETHNLVDMKHMLLGQTTAVMASCKPHGLKTFNYTPRIQAWLADLGRRSNGYRTNDEIPLDLAVFHRPPFTSSPLPESKDKKRKAPAGRSATPDRPSKTPRRAASETCPSTTSNDSTLKVEDAGSDDALSTAASDLSKPGLSHLSRSKRRSDLSRGLDNLRLSVLENDLQAEDERLTELEASLSTTTSQTDRRLTTLEERMDSNSAREQPDSDLAGTQAQLAAAERKIQDLERTVEAMKKEEWVFRRDFKELQAQVCYLRSSIRPPEPPPPPPPPPQIVFPPALLCDIREGFLRASSGINELARMQGDLAKMVQTVVKNQHMPIPTGPKHKGPKPTPFRRKTPFSEGQSSSPASTSFDPSTPDT